MVSTMAVAGLIAMLNPTPQDTVRPRSGLVIQRSTKLAPGEYTLSNNDTTGKAGAITISGDNITVDFSGVVLRGTSATTEPNERVGTGIVITGKNVTIKNAHVHGYKVAVAAWGAENIKVLDSDFSYNWKARLNSTLEKEDTGDWMSFHHNEEDEWLRFGAALYLSDCDGFEVKNVRAVGGQCGLMMTLSDNGVAWNNDFSFLSAVGIGMYRSSDNKIYHNKIDWNVRGYSHGVYNRGQDSTGILIYEQSHRNIFAYNSVTHSGDGFFLWAGQTTMDTGEGGCNDNVLYANDFSHAPTNAIEATFSRNQFVNNLLLENWHGVWGGYSYETKIVGNVFGYNGEAIAIEHGQDNEIIGNVFYEDNTALRIWSNPSQDPNWGYPKNRDTRSRDLLVKDNVFWKTSGTVFSIDRSEKVSLLDNYVKKSHTAFRIGDTVTDISWSGGDVWTNEDTSLSALGAKITQTVAPEIQRSAEHAPPAPVMQTSGNAIVEKNADLATYLKRFQTEWDPFQRPFTSLKTPAEMTPNELRLHHSAPYYVRPMLGGMDPFLDEEVLRGRRYILVDEWGPYDFKRPLLWKRNFTPASERQQFEILGPKGTWRVKRVSEGVRLSAQSGSVPGEVFVDLPPGQVQDMEIVLEYVGEETTDYRGVVTPAGRPVEFKYSKFVVPVDWTVRFWNYDSETQDPREQTEAFNSIFSSDPVLTQRLTDLNAAWGGSPGQGVNTDYFATKADGTFTISPGEYELVITHDDGVRVWLDDKLILEDWTWHAPKTDTIAVTLGGNHRIRIDHFELNGYSTLKVEIRKK